MLFSINVSILLDARNDEEAEAKVESFLDLEGERDLDFNFLQHSILQAADFGSLQQLRVWQEEEAQRKNTESS